MAKRSAERTGLQASARKTYKDAVKYLSWINSKASGSDEPAVGLNLPTAEQLIIGHQSGFLANSGPEWVRGGYIFDPETKTVNENPEEDAKASFRFVAKKSESPDPQ